MALYPALPLFTDAYLADTRHLTTEEHGAYLLLLMCAWRSDGCQLEDDDKTLARIAGLSPTRWRRLKPVMEKFFTVREGVWRQKKLQAVYSDVASRVARNKANGARGGRARAAKAAARSDNSEPQLSVDQHPEKHRPEKQHPEKQHPGGQKSGTQSTSKAVSNFEATNGTTSQPTKAKSKTKKKPPLAADLSDNKSQEAEQRLLVFDIAAWRSRIAAVCADGTTMDDAVIYYWQAAGVDAELDAVPTITAVGKREIVRTGRAPHSLGYYRDAVVEAATARQKAEQGGLSKKLPTKVTQAQKRAFDPASIEDWKALLGDPGSRFRGDQMARNWFISNDHPLFRPRGLGANPRLTATSHIPQPVRDLYGGVWLWL